MTEKEKEERITEKEKEAEGVEDQDKTKKGGLRHSLMGGVKASTMHAREMTRCRSKNER